MYLHRLTVNSAGSIVCIGMISIFLLVATNCYGWAGKSDPVLTNNESTEMDDSPVPCGSTSKEQMRKLVGVVTDQSGARIARAQLTLSCGDFRVAATAGIDGAYSFSVPAGPYRLHVEVPNFASVSQNVTVNDTDSGTELNPILSVGQLKSTITVTSGNEYAVVESTGGTKTALPMSEVPQAVTVVNRQLMDAQDAVKLDDTLKNVAGVVPGGYYDGWDYYRIRGFDASFNTYIDGLRGGNGMMEETWGLESVEVLKGPSSALYGQSVLGGLVNIVTRKPVPDAFTKLQVTTGSFSFVDPSIDIGGSLNSSRTVYGRLAALYHSADSYVDYAYRHRYYLAPSLTLRPSSSTSLTLIGRIQRDNGRQGMPLPAMGTVLANINGPIPIHTFNGELEANANKLSQANQQFGFQFQHKINDYVSVRQNARFAWYQQDWNRIYYPSFLSSDQRTLYRYPLSWHGPWETHEVDTSIDGQGRFWKMEHHALLGMDFFRNPSTSRGYSIDFSDMAQYEPLDLYAPVYGANPVRPLSLYTSSNTVTQYTGVYLQDHIRLPRDFTITAGGRVDFSKNESKGLPNQNATGLTPRIGITWQAIQSTSFYGSFSKSFMPQSGQVFDGSVTGRYLSPERGQQWEVGAKSAVWEGRISTTLALFQLNRKNVATTDPSHPNFYLMTGEQRSRGVEFETTLHPLAGWNLTTAYSYIDAKVTRDTALPIGTPTLNAPKHIFNMWTTYEIPRGFAHGVGIGIGGRHYSEQSGDLADTFQLPGYGIVDASASYRRGPAHWQINVSNLADKRYFGGSYNDLYVKPGEPRVVRGTVSWSF